MCQDILNFKSIPSLYVNSKAQSFAHSYCIFFLLFEQRNYLTAVKIMEYPLEWFVK